MVKHAGTAIFSCLISLLLSGCFIISETEYRGLCAQDLKSLSGMRIGVRGFSVTQTIRTGYSSGGSVYMTHYSDVENTRLRKLVQEQLEEAGVNVRSGNPEFIIVGEVTGGQDFSKWYLDVLWNFPHGFTHCSRHKASCSIRVYSSDGKFIGSIYEDVKYHYITGSPLPFGTFFDSAHWGDVDWWCREMAVAKSMRILGEKFQLYEEATYTGNSKKTLEKPISDADHLCTESLERMGQKLIRHASDNHGVFPAENLMAGENRSGERYLYFGGWTAENSDHLPLLMDLPKNHSSCFYVLMKNGQIKCLDTKGYDSCYKLICLLHSEYRYTTPEFLKLLEIAEAYDRSAASGKQ